jgi:hypothetical protein
MSKKEDPHKSISEAEHSMATILVPGAGLSPSATSCAGMPSTKNKAVEPLGSPPPTLDMEPGLNLVSSKPAQQLDLDGQDVLMAQRSWHWTWTERGIQHAIILLCVCLFTYFHVEGRSGWRTGVLYIHT